MDINKKIIHELEELFRNYWLEHLDAQAAYADLAQTTTTLYKGTPDILAERMIALTDIYERYCNEDIDEDDEY